MNHSNDDKKALVPELRFSEFRGSGEWLEKKIGDVIESENSTLSLNKLEITGTGYPVYGADGLVGYINEFRQNEDYIAIIKDGSGVGRLYLYKKESSVLGTLNYLKLRDINAYSLGWVFYLLQTIDFSTYVKGSGIPHIYFSDYSRQTVLVPLFSEQQKIADCLSSLDELITAENEKLDALKDHKKGLMQNLFPAEGETVPKFRFPEFRDAEEWKEDILDSFCISLTSGKDKPDLNGQFDLFGSTGVIGKSADFSHEGEFILVARVGANAGTLNKVKGVFAVTDNTLVINLHDPKYLEFIYYLLHSLNLKKLVFGSGQPLITSTQLKELKVTVPVSLSEQQKIAECLSSLDELIDEQSKKVETLKEFKKGLMQGLFPNIK